MLPPLISCIAKSKPMISSTNEKMDSRECIKNLNLQDAGGVATKDNKPGGVFFAFVQIREYEMVLGDNPSVSSGPPISLGWEVESDGIYSVDTYESLRNRRARHELIIPQSVRIEWLIDTGYSLYAIREASQAVVEHRCKQVASITKMQLRDKADDFAENLKRAMNWTKGKLDSVSSAAPRTPPPESSRKKLLVRRESSAFL